MISSMVWAGRVLLPATQHSVISAVLCCCVTRPCAWMPTWRTKCRSGFATLPSVPLQKEPTVVLLFEGALVSWSLAMDERGGHEDLCGSGRRSIIAYMHDRT
jgi:hypothetical protein